MARPRSEDKRNAILDAATRVIAVEGVSAPTAKIAKLARVAEGTLFTYFSNKDELLNELYLELKTQLRQTMAAEALKVTKSLKATALHVWTHYVNWGVANPDKRKVLAQLGCRSASHPRAERPAWSFHRAEHRPQPGCGLQGTAAAIPCICRVFVGSHCRDDDGVHGPGSRPGAPVQPGRV